MRLFAYPYPYQPPEQVFAPFSSDRYSLFFDSAREGHPLNRFSYLCVHPFETIEAKNGRVTVTNTQQSLSLTADPFAVIKDRLHDWGAGAQDTRYDLPPFQGGAAGYFGYDLARGIEHLPEQAKDDPSLPDMAIGLYDTIIAFDHAEKNHGSSSARGTKAKRNAEKKRSLKKSRHTGRLETIMPTQISSGRQIATTSRTKRKSPALSIISTQVTSFRPTYPAVTPHRVRPGLIPMRIIRFCAA